MAKWRNQIKIKNLLTNEESDKKVLEVVTALIPQLKRIKTKEDNIHNRQLEQGKQVTINELFLEEFDELIQEFEWIKDSIEKEEDPTQFSYNSWCEAFNNYLEQLYDMGDTLIIKKDFFNDEKFLWVG